MSIDEIDMGFYCPHIAMDLMELDDEIYVFGPSLLNSEVMVSRKSLDRIVTIGYASNRKSLFDKIKNDSNEYVGVEVNKALRYVIEKEEVDAAIVDISELKNYEGYNVYSISQEDYISYALVVRSGIEEKPEFNKFLIAYNDIVKKFDDKSALAERIGVDEQMLDDIVLLELGGN